MPWNKYVSWLTNAIHLRRLFKSNDSIEFPSISIEPLLILYSLNNSFTSVLLPEPVAPTMPTFLPGLIVYLKFFIT